MSGSGDEGGERCTRWPHVLLTEVHVVEVAVEVGSVASLQPSAQAKVTQLDVPLCEGGGGGGGGGGEGGGGGGGGVRRRRRRRRRRREKKRRRKGEDRKD